MEHCEETRRTQGRTGPRNDRRKCRRKVRDHAQEHAGEAVWVRRGTRSQGRDHETVTATEEEIGGMGRETERDQRDRSREIWKVGEKKVPFPHPLLSRVPSRLCVAPPCSVHSRYCVPSLCPVPCAVPAPLSCMFPHPALQSLRHEAFSE